MQGQNRLLRQPCGFEGFLDARVHLHPERQSVAERPHLSEVHVDRNPAGLRTSPLVGDGDHALPEAKAVLDLELPVIPSIRPLGVEPVRSLGSGIDLLAWPAESGHIPDQVRMRVDLTAGLPVLVALSDDLHVLLGHRHAVSRSALWGASGPPPVMDPFRQGIPCCPGFASRSDGGSERSTPTARRL